MTGRVLARSDDRASVRTTIKDIRNWILDIFKIVISNFLPAHRRKISNIFNILLYSLF